DRRAEVYLGRLGSAEACQFKVNGTKRYDLACFVEDFNDAKGLNLANLRLGTDGRATWMEVDGRRIEILDSKLTTFGSMVNLLGTIGKENWLGGGARMYWSHYDRRRNLAMIQEAKFRVIQSRTSKQKDGTHLFVLAQR
ncbi:MAG: hypothetical protein JRN51_10415, partial [Nitrososphaerota archaeon]|nr:hypothetical protein [Nitrososphaerota archaeon]